LPSFSKAFIRVESLIYTQKLFWACVKCRGIHGNLIITDLQFWLSYKKPWNN